MASPPDISVILSDVAAILKAVGGLATGQQVLALTRQVTALQTSVDALTDGQKVLSDMLGSMQAHFDSRLDAIVGELTTIEAEVNPAIPFIPPLQFWSPVAMAFVTAINPTVAVPSSVICQDLSTPPQNIPGSQISWVITGLASNSDVAITLGADGNTFTFTPSGTNPTELATATATWNPPMGNTQPSFAGTLTVNLVAAVAPEAFVPPMQFELTAGA